MRQYPHDSERLHTNDVYMVDDSVALIASTALFLDFIGDLEGLCIFLTPGACVISNAYGEDAEASTELSNAIGSDNGVDVLIRKSTFESYEINIPPSIRFNHCIDPNKVIKNKKYDEHYYPYTTMVHEAGHALGTSGFSRWKLFSVSIPKEFYKRAHPYIPDAVMNYDDRINDVSDEPDCSPHPFDILAIWALYQAVDR